MKTYKIIGFTLWTIGNILITLRLWNYLSVAPLFTVHIIISVCCSILFCIDFSSRIMKAVIYFLSAVIIQLAVYNLIYFCQPLGIITVISPGILICKNVICEPKKQYHKFVTKVVASIALAILFVSIVFYGREFFISKQTGLVNGETVVWSCVDEKFFNELAKDCSTQEEVARKGHEWIVENIKYDYGKTYPLDYQYFNIEETLQTKTGICFEFANLFAAYCRSQGIPCFIIDGQNRTDYTKGHSWNRVYLNGSWWDVDTTNDANTNTFYGFRKLDSLNAEDLQYIITRIY